MLKERSKLPPDECKNSLLVSDSAHMHDAKTFSIIKQEKNFERRLLLVGWKLASVSGRA